MENFKVILAETLQGEETVPVVEAHDLVLSFQGLPNGSGLSEGNISISGKQTAKLLNGQSQVSALTPLNIRLKEQETLIAAMPAGDAKTEAQAKFDVWNTFLTSVQTALDVAMKANYELDNPVEENA